MKDLWSKWSSWSLILRICMGLALGIGLGYELSKIDSSLATSIGTTIPFLGTLFVSALKAVAPLLVFMLVMSALAQHKEGSETNMKHIIFLYVISTLVASAVAVVASFMFPTEIILKVPEETITSPGGIGEVIKAVLLNVVDNPIKALYNGNYIGVLAGAVVLGIALRSAGDNTKEVIGDFSNAVSKVVGWIIQLAPFGIMGLVFETVYVGGLEELESYLRLILVLVGSMFFVAFITNPIIVFMNIKKNPYPLVFKCLKESGLTAFFTRSSAANIPINMKMCEDLGLDKDTYAVSIPLGATINMAGAAITINVLTLAAAYTLGIEVDIFMAMFLGVVAAVSACGASGVAGGSLLLIPLACSLFGISEDISSQVVAVGFVVGVIQDSCETALNSSTDVLLTATADYAKKIKEGKVITLLK